MKIVNLFPPVLQIIFLIASNLSFSVSQLLCHGDERIALSQLKDSFMVDQSSSISGPLACSKLSSWKVLDQQSDCCSWKGIECDEKTGHVISLDLGSSCLFGSIDSSSSLFRLSHLKRLNLSHNHFNYSRIPPGLGRLSELTNLDLSSAFLAGEIPAEVSGLAGLSSLDLGDNDLSSGVPRFLANLTSLTRLQLKNCSLSGEFPAEIFHLPKLEVLSVTLNQNLSGSLPEFLSGSSLKRLVISGTSFSGSIPPSIGNLGSLEYLTVARAKFSGPLPSSLGKLTSLTHLDFTSNRFTGPVPSFLQNLTNLGTLWFRGNQLTGPIPPWLGNLTSLKVLSLAGNNLHGHVPESLSRLTNLRTLNLYENRLSGSLDFEFFVRDMKSLAELRFDDNELQVITKADDANSTLGIKFEILGLKSCNVSHFPGFLRNQDKLRYLDLAGNRIRGPIPEWIWNTSRETLAYLALTDNFLTIIGQSQPVKTGLETGATSDLFCNLTSLQLLDLSNNALNGMRLPKCLESPKISLSVLNINNNFFHGTIPQLSSNLLKMIDLSYNKLNGQIPRSLENCSSLESLDLSNNELVDVFPSWLRTLPELRLLILRSNRLHGEISNPTSDPGFRSLRVIDLSRNDFTGPLPSKYFRSWNAMKIPKRGDSYLKTKSSFEALKRNWSLEYAYTTSITVKGVEIQYGKIQEVLVVIDFSSNKFEGAIPDSISSLRGLRVLNLSNNILSGRIPTSLGDLSTLESLDLSGNGLSREIPPRLAKLTFLSFFDVSDNELSGRIPRGNQLDTFENASYARNPGLCGYPLSRKCEEHAENSGEAEKEDSKSSVFDEFNWTTIVLGFGNGLAIGIVIQNYFMGKKRVVDESLFEFEEEI